MSAAADRRARLGPRVEALATQLVQEAPARDPAAIAELAEALAQIATPLASAIARILELIDEDLVDPGPALPALAEACAAVADLRADAGALEAARYRIETLEPVPDRGPALVAPDVPVDALRRR